MTVDSALAEAAQSENQSDRSDSRIGRQTETDPTAGTVRAPPTEPAPRSTGANTVVTERPVTTLAAFLNRTFGLDLASRAEACGWLAGGGWPKLESWLAAHRNDRPRRAVTPPQETR